MKTQYRGHTKSIIALSIILILMVVLIPVITFFNIDESYDPAITILISYGAMSPVLILIFMILRYNMISRIIVTGTEIEAVSPGTRITIPWQSITCFIYDYISVANGSNYIIYQVSGDNELFRFNSLMTDDEKLHSEDVCPAGVFDRKSFSFNSYGLYLEKKICDRLVRFIADFSGVEPVRSKGMF